MALVDVIKHESPSDRFFVWKYPNEKIKMASQLIVGEGQKAIFVKGGEALDIFDPGTHTLSTGNLPILNRIINLPFGRDTPFPAEIWYVATTVKRDLKWGTSNPIQLMDKSIGFPVSVRAFGQWGVRIVDPRSFLMQIVGSQSLADDTKIHSYLIGEIIQTMSNRIAENFQKGISILEINANLNELSSGTLDDLKVLLNKYGLELVNFNIENINISKDELKKIQDVMQKTFEAKEFAKVDLNSNYATMKSFEIMGDAAKNESDGGVGAMMQAGIGLGAGLPLGQQMGQQMNVGNEQSSQTAHEKLASLKKLLDDDLITEDQFKEKQAKILENF